MKCEGCGASVSYQDGQGVFKCSHCGSVYEATAGQSVPTTLMLKKLDDIGRDVKETRDFAKEKRLQEKAQAVQDKIDYKYIEFENSLGRKAGSAAFILGAIAILCLFGAPKGLIGTAIFGAAAAGAFMMFKNAKAQYAAAVAQLKEAELDPIYADLRKLGAVLDGGAVSVGYTESTAVPMRYCVVCHANVTPAKAGGSGGGGSMRGANLLLVVMTCGLWIPAWIMIEAMSKAGGVAGRALRSGACPKCGNQTLFPARLPA
jgi:predicted RNA-binding Zn-ribbon protein involved in translation (DUF1610 family)